VPETYATPEIRVETTEEKKWKIVEATTKHFQEQGAEVNTIDGARVEFADGWGLIRASNTSPALVMRFEAESAKRLKEIRKMVEGKVSELNQ
jgi:phosphomannomutase/phosphoglucomutase